MTHGCYLCVRPNRGNANYNCVSCCVRFLGTLPTKQHVLDHMLSIERIIGPEKMKDVREKWAEHVAERSTNRNSTKEKHESDK